jgi:hypothetical protein
MKNYSVETLEDLWAVCVCCVVPARRKGCELLRNLISLCGPENK